MAASDTKPRVSIPVFVWIAVGTVALAAVVAGLSRAAGAQTTLASPVYVKQVLEAAAEYARKAEQDGIAAHRLRDAHYGLAYINAARALRLSDAELERISTVRVADLQAKLRAVQAEAETHVDDSSLK
jgi:hypothetical protein